MKKQDSTKSKPLSEFIGDYIVILGIAPEDRDEYIAKVGLTAAGKTLIALEANPDDRVVLTAVMEEAERDSVPPDVLFTRAFPDGRHIKLYQKMVIKTLIEISESMNESLGDDDVARLAALINEPGTGTSKG